MFYDQTCRGGLSIQLSTELVGKCCENEDTMFLTKIDKIGKYIGFCSMEMFNSNGQLIARGKHIKFMTMSSLWDIFMGPFFLPISVSLFLFITSNPIGLKFSRTFLKNLDERVSPLRQKLHLLESLSDLIYLVPHSGSSLFSEDSLVFEWSAGADFHNGIGILHGGAIALAIEAACILAGEKLVQSSSIISDLQVTYLASPKVGNRWVSGLGWRWHQWDSIHDVLPLISTAI
mmetsp:Transcript_30044/g.42889  ORF Transcript_30044/g.42889 Transcript_30044/m.42889 type:complete len:232 (-) Transcript_30044:136-831(-)